MGKRIRSAKGVMVDFDLIKIKQQMASAPPPVDVRARKDFIDRRLKRKIKKAIDDRANQTTQVEDNNTKDVNQPPMEDKKTNVKQKARPDLKKSQPEEKDTNEQTKGD